MASNESGNSSKSVSHHEGLSLCNKLDAILKARNKIICNKDTVLPDALVEDIDLSDIQDGTTPSIRPHKHLQDNEQIVKSLMESISTTKKMSEKEMNFVINEERNQDIEVIQTITRLRQQSDKLFKRIINAQVGFNECLNSDLMTDNSENKNYIDKHIKLIEETCKYNRGVEAIIGCDKDKLEKCIKKDFDFQNVDEFKTAYNELADEKLSKVYEDGVKTFKNHEHLISIKKYNKSSSSGIVVGSVETEGRIDPFTQQPIKKPVRNKVCNHIYDLDSIDQMFQRKLFICCPLIGCSNKRFTKKDILYNFNSSDDSE